MHNIRNEEMVQRAARVNAAYARLLVDTVQGCLAADSAELTVDEYGTITVRQVGEETVQVLPMIYNDRIVIGTDPTTGYQHGWCYDKGGPALLCALLWDPANEDEPIGYKKQATPGHRVAPNRRTA